MSSAGGTGVVFSLQLTRFFRGARLKIALAVLGVVVLGIAAVFHAKAAGGAAANTGDSASALATSLATWTSATEFAVMSLLVFVLPFMFGTGLIAEEVSGRTLPFLFVRPVGRARVLLGKYLGAAALTVPLLFLTTAALYVSCLLPAGEGGGEGAAVMFRTAGAAALLALYYCAVCLFWSTVLPAEANVITAIHFAILEFGLGKAPGFLRYGSANYLGRIVAGFAPEAGSGEVLPAWAPYGAAGAIAALTALVLGLALLAGTSREYRMGDIA